MGRIISIISMKKNRSNLTGEKISLTRGSGGGACCHRRDSRQRALQRRGSAARREPERARHARRCGGCSCELRGRQGWLRSCLRISRVAHADNLDAGNGAKGFAGAAAGAKPTADSAVLRPGAPFRHRGRPKRLNSESSRHGTTI